jgi:DNA-binding LacI/PurR family transcriptional regulator
MPVPKSQMTISDIARLANVSKSTVSRALNDSPLIGKDTKARIRSIADSFHFQLNIPARQLSLRHSHTIAFVIHPFNEEYSIADLFILEIMGGISRGLHSNGYDMLVIHADRDDVGWAPQYLNSHRVDGFILLTSAWKQRHIQTLIDLDAPFIVWGVPDPHYQICCVSGDNFTGGKLATRHLIDTGRKQIGFLGGPSVELEVQERFKGYCSALNDAGRKIDPGLIEYADYSHSSAIAAMQRLLEKSPLLDAVFVNSDLMAIAAMETVRQNGRRVPADIAVVGYDGLSISALSNPPLTTIRQDLPMAGEYLAQGLIRYIQTGEVTRITMPVDLVVRQSA